MYVFDFKGQFAVYKSGFQANVRDHAFGFAGH